MNLDRLPFILGAKAALLLSYICLTNVVFAQMAPGNIVVNTVGNGSSTLTNAGWRVNARVINQANGSTLNNFSGPVNPSSGNKFSGSGTSLTEGCLNLTLNGRYLTMVGYNADSTQSVVSGTTSSSVARVIARVDSAGNFNVATSTSSGYSSNPIRGSASEDGSSYYISGVANSASNGGFKLISHGSTSTTNISTSVGGSGANLRWTGMYASYDTSSASLDKNIYVSTNSGTAGIYQISSGLPTSLTTSNTLIAGISSPFGFVFLDASATEPGLDLLYTSNDSSHIQKFYKNAGTWSSAGTFSISGIRGITGYITSQGRVKLIMTQGGSSTTAGRLFYAWDNAAFNANINLQNSSNANLTLSNRNILFSTDSTKIAQRGVAFTPTFISSQPTDMTACIGIPSSFTVSMYAPSNSDSAVYNYYWQRSSDGGSTWVHVTNTLDGGIYSNIRSASLTITATNLTTNNYRYRCLVQYMSQYWLYTNIAILTVNSSPVITLDPVGFSGCTYQSFTLSGSAINATSYQWSFNNAIIPSATSTSYTVNPAGASNSGNYALIAINGVCKDTSATAIVSIAGKINAYPYQDPINSGPDCYSTSAISGSAVWTKSSSMSTGLTPSTGQMYVYPSSFAPSGSAAELITPTFDLTNVSNPVLTFRWAVSNTNLNANDSVNIAYSNDNFTNTYLIRTAYRISNTTNWQINHITLSSLGGLNNVRFKFTGYAVGNGADLAIDSIAVKESQCPEASGKSSLVANNLVTLSWNNSPNTVYELRYKPATSNTWLAYIPSPVTSPVSFYLNPNTTYNWQVRSICSNNTDGWPVSTESFTTGSSLINCLQVKGLQQTVSNCSTAVASWNNTATADSFVVRLWIFNPVNNNWTVVSSNVLINSYSVTFGNLLASRNYRWRVARYCNGVELNSSLSTFSTPSCRLSGINSEENSISINLYPNPNNGLFHLEFPSNGEYYSIAISDLNGKIVLNQSDSSDIESTKIQIRGSDLSSGVYILKLTIGNSEVFKKLTIQ